jgi:pilus assembly protein CpaC
MRNIVKKAWGAAVAGLAVAAMLPGHAPEARAGGDAVGRRGGPTAGPVTLNTGHQSVLRLKESDLNAQSKAITLGRNKSMLVELPRDLRDVIVSSPDIVDAVVQTSNRVYLIGKKTGPTNAFFFDVHGEQILTLEIMVEFDTAALDLMLRRLIPGSSIKSEILNETVILTGTVRSPIDSSRAVDIASRFMVTGNPSGDEKPKSKVINMLAVEGEEQVMLRVTVAEVSRSLMKQLGINLGSNFSAGNMVVNLLTNNSLPLTAAKGLGTLPTPGYVSTGNNPGLSLFNSGPSLGGVPSFGNSGVATAWTSGTATIQQALRMLERDGLVRTLAEPNLTAVSGETAKFLVGGEYPVPVVDSTGALSVTFKEFGIGLAFTPIVMSEGRISLKIETEVSELSNEGSVTLSNINIPALKKRQAKSTVELPSGGSLALAGLISENIRQNIDGFPGLKDVPVLGTLFRSRDFIREETELVVIITPYTVRPTSRQQLGRPDDGLAPATDMKANFLGHLNRIYGRGGPHPPDGGLKGSYGFIVE